MDLAAVYSTNKDALKYFFEKGEELTFLDNNEDSIFHLLAKNSKFLSDVVKDIVLKCISMKNDRNNSGRTPIMTAAMELNISFFKFLLEMEHLL